MKIIIQKLLNKFGYMVMKTNSPYTQFGNHWYIRHNQRRQEHLVSLDLDLFNKSVLEVGAGIGDHTSFFTDRNCVVLSTDAREENISIHKIRYPNVNSKVLDLEKSNPDFDRKFDIVYCYGLLYHLSNPEEIIYYLAQQTNEMILLETCVSFEKGDALELITEDCSNPTQAKSGKGSLPTRSWLYNKLKRHFKFVYLPTTQPCHPEFPLDWTMSSKSQLTRAIFIASHSELINSKLCEEIPMKQSW